MATNQTNTVQSRVVPFDYGNYSENNAFYARINAKKEKEALKKAKKAVKKATKKAAKKSAKVPAADLQLSVVEAAAVDACQDRVAATLEAKVQGLDYIPKDLWNEALASGDETKCEKFARFIANATAKEMANEGTVPEDKQAAAEKHLFTFYMNAIKAEIAERGAGKAILADRASMVAVVLDVCDIAGMSDADKELAVKASNHVHAKATARRAAKKVTVPAVDSVPVNSAMADALTKAQVAKK